ncbi:hypothetical protein AB0G79_20225 [Streptomyces sp. NPDC020807]|uniref:hypothetical protein n=1 Tax=Streptomyces sp. NPDC020807 TaxID=3155119 RepID=UPI0033DD0BE2
MTSTKQRAQPFVFLSTDQGVPGHLYYPEGADPALVVSQFPPGFFGFSETGGYATFDPGRSIDVITALHQDWPYVDVSYGKYEGEPTSSTTVKRPAGSLPKSWRVMEPRTTASSL